jgi:hypothetical protein
MLKNAERSHHVVENKGKRFGTNPKAQPTWKLKTRKSKIDSSVA